MTDRVRPLIEHHYAMEDTFGMGVRQVERIVKAVADRAGISKPVSPHVLRHSFSVTCLKRGVGLRTLQALLAYPGRMLLLRPHVRGAQRVAGRRTRLVTAGS